MKNGVSAIPKGMNAATAITEVMVPALIDAAWDNNGESVIFIRGLINEVIEEALPNQKTFDPPADSRGSQEVVA